MRGLINLASFNLFVPVVIIGIAIVMALSYIETKRKDKNKL
jgi:hypothetical protein